MLMSDPQILEAIEKKELIINPFSPSKLKGASYDLTLGKEALVSNRDEKVVLGPDTSSSLSLQAGDFALVLTQESVKFPMNMAASIGMRSGLARMGLILLHGMQIDPGFEGHLRFGLYNSAPRRITLDYGDDLCMLEFHKLSVAATKECPPNDDLIKGRIPEGDKQFLRMLETTSLSKLSEDVRGLSKSVQELAHTTQQLTNQSKIAIGGIIAILIAVIANIIKGMIR